MGTVYTPCGEPHPFYDGIACEFVEGHSSVHTGTISWPKVEPRDEAGELFYQVAQDWHDRWCICRHRDTTHRHQRDECVVGGCECEQFGPMTIEQFIRWRIKS